MAQTVTEILVKFKDSGANTVGAAFKKITREARGVERSFQRLSDSGVRKLRTELNSLKNAGVNTIGSMRAQKNSLLALRDMADVAGNEFKQLTAEIARLDARMKKATVTSGGLKSRLKGFAKGAGSVAAGGIFGGVEGALGAGIGLALGGAPGAVVGGAIGAQAKMFREQLGGLAEFSAALELQRKALGLVIGDTEKFAKSQQFLLETSRKLAIPQSVITRQFTSLTASVVGAGKSVEDAEEVFRAIAAGIRGTGGNLEDMKAAMRAVSQVFSKGKVSAEELRQQLGERLPGAFTLFADSMDMTPAQLDKALEQGKVTLDDFMLFAKKLFATYGINAEILASSPEAAGDRLRTSLEELNDDLGSLLKPIGMQFQTLADDIVKQFGRIIKQLRKMVDGIASERKLIDALMLTKNERQAINTKAKDEAVKQIGSTVLTKEAADKIAALYDANPVADFLGVREMKKKYLYDNVGKTFDDLNSFTFDMFHNYELAFDKNLADVTTNIRRNMMQEMFSIVGETGDTSFSAFRKGLSNKSGKATKDNKIGGGGGGGQITKTITEGAKLLQQQERLLDLKAIEDKFEKQILKRKQDAAIEKEKINQMTVGEDEKGFDTAEQKAKALANVEKLLQQDILKIKGEQKAAEADKALAIGKIKFELGLITEKEFENLQITKEAADKYNELKANGELFGLTLDEIKEKLIGVKTETNTFAESFKKVYDAATDLTTNISNLAVQGIDKLGDAFADFVVTGKASFKELAASILADLGRMIAKALFFRAISNFLPPSIKNFLNIGGGGSPKVKGSAKGNVFAKNKIVPYAKGGILSNSIVDKPTIFPMAKGGIGLMAEAGYPEAIMPLKRGRDGKLGVISQGGGVNNVTVNVDASGSSVEGDSGQAEQLGRAISEAIQTELVQQKRPGGLLYN